MLIQIDILHNKQVVRRFTRRYKCPKAGDGCRQHDYAREWGRRQVVDEGIEYDVIKTKTMEVK